MILTCNPWLWWINKCHKCCKVIFVSGLSRRCLCAQMCSTLCNPRTAARRAPLSMGFPRHEYWSGLPFPSPGGSSQPRDGIMSPVVPPLAGRFFTTEPPGKHVYEWSPCQNGSNWKLASVNNLHGTPTGKNIFKGVEKTAIHYNLKWNLLWHNWWQVKIMKHKESLRWTNLQVCENESQWYRWAGTLWKYLNLILLSQEYQQVHLLL